MTSSAAAIEKYMAELPDDRKQPMNALRNEIIKSLPKGFLETMSYNMIGYVVPHSLYPKGYHCNPELPLPFVNIGSQKNFIALHHIGLYGNQTLFNWFVNEYPKYSKTKLDMGKACIRFKKPEHMPLELIGELMRKITPTDWINMYESTFAKSA